MARQNSAAKTTAKSKTDPATEKPKDETLPGSTDATSSTAPEASAAKPQTAPATEAQGRNSAGLYGRRFVHRTRDARHQAS
ncbi:hypothetical protein [Pseudomonas aeruginosa]|uniref:hypothetical protein n=1 Tax=Pseudomonas aeruginosa TaxID=287 RepID=UPI003D6F7E6B